MKNNNIHQTLAQYNNLFKKMDKIYHMLARHYGMSDCSFWILYSLRETDEMVTQSELCGTLYASKQTINSALKKLETDGFIILKTLADNKKAKQITLTPLGEELARKSVDRVIEVEQNAFSHLSETERQDLITLLQKQISCLQDEAEHILSS